MEMTDNERELFAVEQTVDAVLAANPQARADACLGDDKAFEVLVGIVLRVAHERVTPNQVKELIQTKLSCVADVSALPPLEQVREANTMRIIVVNTLTFPKEVLKTSLYVVDHNGERSALHAPIIKIADDRVKGYMPSKVWWKPILGDMAFDVLYYINPSLPKAAQPFKDNTYMMTVATDKASELEYDLSMRIFIDQVKTDIGMMHVIMFGDETYDLIVAKDEE